MIYPKPCNIKGVILIDVMLAMSLAVLFIVIITTTSSYSRHIFDKARERRAFLDSYETALIQNAHEEVLIPYGNQMIEAVMPTFPFVRVGARSNIDLSKAETDALCSVNFTNQNVLGSFEWLNEFEEGTTSDVLDINILTHTLPINPTIPLTYLQVRNDIAYVSADSNIASDPDLFIFRLKNGGLEELVSYINTGPGITAFVIVGKRIFAAVPSVAAQLHVIEQDSWHNLFLLKKYRLDLPYATATPALGSAIEYSDGVIFLGTEKWAGNEFVSIDVNNPISPDRLSGLEIDSKVSHIYVNDDAAYISTAALGQLQSIDIRNPSNLIWLSSFSPTGWERQEGEVATIFENSLNFGRTSGGYDVFADHEIFSIPSTSLPILPDNPDQYRSSNIKGGVYGIVKDRIHTYFITKQFGSEFQVFSNDLNSSSTKVFSLPGSPQNISCYRDRIFILSKVSPEIYEIQIRRVGH